MNLDFAHFTVIEMIRSKLAVGHGPVRAGLLLSTTDDIYSLTAIVVTDRNEGQRRGTPKKWPGACRCLRPIEMRRRRTAEFEQSSTIFPFSNGQRAAAILGGQRSTPYRRQSIQRRLLLPLALLRACVSNNDPQPPLPAAQRGQPAAKPQDHQTAATTAPPRYRSHSDARPRRR